MNHVGRTALAPMILAQLALVAGCRAPVTRGADGARESGPEAAIAEPAARVADSPPTEVFLVLARAGQPAELRLRDETAPRYPLATRSQVAAVLEQRSARSVTVRHGRSVPAEELADLVAFLRANGVEHVTYRIAPPPPSNPTPAVPGR